VVEARESVKDLFQYVMDDLGHEGWALRWWEHDAYCWRSRKIIDICPMGSLEECEQMLLHEIAHIDIVVSHGSQHTERFWEYLEELTNKYLGSGLSEWQEYFRHPIEIEN